MKPSRRHLRSVAAWLPLGALAIALLALAPAALADGGLTGELNVVAGAPVTDLVPGGTATSAYSIENSGSEAVLRSVQLDSIRVEGDPGCTKLADADVVAVPDPLPPLGMLLPARSVSTDPAFSVSFTMGPRSLDECQGASFTPVFNVTAETPDDSIPGTPIPGTPVLDDPPASSTPAMTGPMPKTGLEVSLTTLAAAVIAAALGSILLVASRRTSRT